jgi:hypothetical protein
MKKHEFIGVEDTKKIVNGHFARRIIKLQKRYENFPKLSKRFVQKDLDDYQS